MPKSKKPIDDRLERALAETENLRKRFDREQLELRKYAVAGLIEDLLPVVDNFYRAVSHVPEDQQQSPWVQGIQYIQKNLLDVLEQQGLTELETKAGDSFDPNTQEAIGTVERVDLPEDQIVEVTAKGYRLHDRLLRPAQVVVSKAIITS